MDFLLYGVILTLALGLLGDIIFKWIAPDKAPNKPALIILAVSLIIICALLAWFKHQAPPYEVKRYNDIQWGQLISGARKRVLATGTFLTKFDPPQVQDLIQKINNNEISEAKLFMLKPNGDSINARISHENPPLIPSELAGKLITFRELIKELNPSKKDKLAIQCYDIYPTIAVIVIDDDLYAYPLPLRPTGDEFHSDYI